MVLEIITPICEIKKYYVLKLWKYRNKTKKLTNIQIFIFNTLHIETLKKDGEIGDVLSGEFVVWVKCKHRICLFKRKWAKPKPLLQTERARIKGEKSFYSCSCFSSVDMSTSLTRYAFATLELDILSLRANSIWEKSLVCEANISSASAHIERRRRISKIPQGIYLDACYL